MFFIPSTHLSTELQGAREEACPLANDDLVDIVRVATTGDREVGIRARLEETVVGQQRY
jgi:hypothetical protein